MADNDTTAARAHEGAPFAAVLEALRGLDLHVEVEAGGALLQIWRMGNGKQRVLARSPRAEAQVPSELTSLPELLVVSQAKQRDAERWIATGKMFADTAGNANLDLPGLVVRILGRQAKRSASERSRSSLAPRAGAREWRGPTLRLLFQLLCKPALIDQSIRELARSADVSPGTVTHLFEDLEAEGHLLRIGRTQRRFTPGSALVDRWTDAYVRRLRDRLLVGRFTATKPDWHEGFKPEKHGALWGGEPAARRLGADLRPGVWTLYTRDEPVQVLGAAGLRKDPAGQVELRRQFWPDDTTPVQERMVGVAPRLLVVADLIATRDPRCLGAARQLAVD